MSSNTPFFDYLLLLQRGGFLKTALEEAALFLKEMSHVHGSNLAFASSISDREKELTLLMSRYSTWRSSHDRIDSRDAGVQIGQINHSLTELMAELKGLPEIAYINFGKVEKAEPVQLPAGGMSRWVIIASGVSFLLVLSFIIWPFIPKSDGIIDKSRCWVTTKPVFAELHYKPQFVPNPMTTLPGTKSYQVDSVVVGKEFGQKYFQITDKKMKMTGWVSENDLKFISPLCFQQVASPETYNIIFDEIKVDYFGPLPNVARNYRICFEANAGGTPVSKQVSEPLKTFFPNLGPPQPVMLGKLKLSNVTKHTPCTIRVGFDNQIDNACSENAYLTFPQTIDIEHALHGKTWETTESGNFTVTIRYHIEKVK